MKDFFIAVFFLVFSGIILFGTLEGISKGLKCSNDVRASGELKFFKNETFGNYVFINISCKHYKTIPLYKYNPAFIITDYISPYISSAYQYLITPQKEGE